MKKVLIADKYSRAASGGVGYAKAAGNYAGQFFPTNLAKEQGFDQIIWTDSNEHKYLEEAGTMNVFFRINDSLVTAPITDTILDGVTRKSIIQIANDMGITVEIKKISTNVKIHIFDGGHRMSTSIINLIAETIRLEKT